MNKIVCNLCGTSYPDTASQCPICGTAKTDSNKSTTGGEAGYAYVKGGRFSKANVRRRNAGQKDLPRVVAPVKPKKEAPAAKPEKKPAAETAAKKTTPVQPKDEQLESRKSNVLLMLIAALLVIAIIVVCGYIAKEFFWNDKPEDPNAGDNRHTNAADQVPCTGLSLSVSGHTFTTAGETMMLSVKTTPENTTDPLRYVSSDEQVATVDEKGIVTAVANGTATVFVYCGDQMTQFEVTCDVPVEPTEPLVVLELNRTECNLIGFGATHNLYDGELDVTAITWTSTDETVATVKNGVVTAVGNGAATIIAEYMDQVVTCAVLCADVVVSEYELRTRFGSGEDFTISVGDTIDLYLIDSASGLRIQAENLSFTLSKEGVITINSKGKITAVATGRVLVTVTYGDQKFEAIVRVSK